MYEHAINCIMLKLNFITLTFNIFPHYRFFIFGPHAVALGKNVSSQVTCVLILKLYFIQCQDVSMLHL